MQVLVGEDEIAALSSVHQLLPAQVLALIVCLPPLGAVELHAWHVVTDTPLHAFQDRDVAEQVR